MTRLGDRTFYAALIGVAVAGVLFTGSAAVLSDRGGTAGVGVGALLAFVNFWVIGQVTHGMVAASGRKGALWGAAAVLKLVVLVGGLWLVLRSGSISVLGVAVGYGALPVGVVVGSLLAGPGAERAQTPSPESPPPAQARDVPQGGAEAPPVLHSAGGDPPVVGPALEPDLPHDPDRPNG